MAFSILLIDDSVTVRALVKVVLIFVRRDFKVLEASDARQALEILDENTLDLVITDLNMPGLDGLALLKLLRADERPALQSIPVIMLTSDRSAGLEERAALAGATGFVRKPVSSEDLLTVLRRVLPAALTSVRPPGARQAASGSVKGRSPLEERAKASAPPRRRTGRPGSR